MPKEKKLTKILPKVYKWKAENLGLFFFIKGQQQIIPTITVEMAINNYMRFMGITPDEWGYDSMRATYNQLQKEFFECQKDEGTKKDK